MGDFGENRILSQEEIDLLLGAINNAEEDKKDWGSVIEGHRSEIFADTSRLKEERALAVDIVKRGPQQVIGELTASIQNNKKSLDKLEEWDDYFKHQEEIDRNFDELTKHKAWLDEEIKGRSLGGTLSPADEMMGRSKDEVVSPKLSKELKEVEERLKEYKEKIPAELLGQNDQGYDDTTNELIKIAKERREQIAKERKEREDRERAERERAARGEVAEEPEESLHEQVHEQAIPLESVSPAVAPTIDVPAESVAQEPVIETSPPAPADQPDEETPVETLPQIQVEPEEEVAKLVPAQPRPNPGLIDNIPVSFRRPQAQPVVETIPEPVAQEPVIEISPPAPVAPIDKVTPRLVWHRFQPPRLEEKASEEDDDRDQERLAQPYNRPTIVPAPAQIIPVDVEQGPKDLLSRLKDKLSSNPDRYTSFETTPQEVLDYSKTFELPMGAKIIDAKPVEIGENYIIIEGTADGRASGKNSFKVKLESDGYGAVSAKILDLKLSWRARAFKGKIENSLKNINKDILDKINENIDPLGWYARGFGIAEGKLSIDLRRDRYH